ncbi:uncharacterized protein LOC131334428 [Rhododendron vialii]|uniref:uncharacterized protein LOC131334428 n=1 Tax=Rhododendron vialii TaxID=182163 RepID=UPI0026604DA2|nr:uncharacterized protein LOC131334428 [Rhododendron vialii]
MLHEVFKPRGHMSTMVMMTMTEWLMKQEKAKALIKDGVPRPTRHMFSSSFVNNLLNFDKVQDQKVIEDPVDANILGYDVAMCNVASFTVYFLSNYHCPVFVHHAWVPIILICNSLWLYAAVSTGVVD